MLTLSHTLQDKKKDYYHALEESSKSNDINSWLLYFSNAILSAQQHTYQMIHFLITKTKLYHRFHDQLNLRQQKVIARLFREGVEGFKRGLSADNYRAITKTSASTATRDLQDLVQKGILTRMGQQKSTRYFLNL